jgi:hypothetical protein
MNAMRLRVIAWCYRMSLIRQSQYLDSAVRRRLEAEEELRQAELWEALRRRMQGEAFELARSSAFEVERDERRRFLGI